MASTIWKGYLTFGLVSIPIKLFRAARAEKIHMHRLERSTGARVRQVFAPVNDFTIAPTPANQPAAAVSGPSLVTAKKQAAPIDVAPQHSPDTDSENRETAQPRRNVGSSDLVRGFEFEKDKYVAFEPEELEKIAPQATHDMEILEFVRFEEVDPIYLESSYYVAAGECGDKPYALLFETLKKTGYAAIAEFVMHRRDQTMLLRPGQAGIVGHTLFYEDEVTRENAFRADSKLVSAKEMDLATKLVEALAAKFDPAKFKDKFRERLQGAISAKIESRVIDEAPAGAKTAPVVDIMTALRESLKAAKKPVASEPQILSTNMPAKKKGKFGQTG